MRTALRRSISWMTLLLPALAIGCGGGDETADSNAPAGGPAVQATQVENPGVITGMVRFTGTPPANEPIDMSDESVCADKHTGPVTHETVIANDNGTLRNVFVYVKEGLQGNFPAPQEPEVLDQEGCMYHPHVMGIQTGQPLEIKNSDGILHNINATGERNRGFNFGQPTTMSSERRFNTPEVMIPVRCDVHGWMEAYIGVVDNPYYAVTGDDGSFRIENLPPGTYTIEAWHEKYGTQTQQVTVAPNQTQETSFEYDAATMADAIVPLGPPLEPHAHFAGR